MNIVNLRSIDCLIRVNELEWRSYFLISYFIFFMFHCSNKMHVFSRLFQSAKRMKKELHLLCRKVKEGYSLINEVLSIAFLRDSE